MVIEPQFQHQATVGQPIPFYFISLFEAPSWLRPVIPNRFIHHLPRCLNARGIYINQLNTAEKTQR